MGTHLMMRVTVVTLIAQSSAGKSEVGVLARLRM